MTRQQLVEQVDGQDLYDPEGVRTRKPTECPYCQHSHFHKTETRCQVYQDLVNNQIVTRTLKRQRYRCAGCSMKVWDEVENLDTYRRKTFRLLRHLEQEKSRKKLAKASPYPLVSVATTQ